ncbi:hypothetical protein CABS01_14185 [Colletotrichum abscissum]|uniref:Tat pathway signal sequence n=1 Tax=Colletotrichum abscissum TaxID=1671311 RepID=A0A9P9X8F0_9PEZI|nr:uncharacterized protein CABS01_14185 [Colletotrichum abscissum]KAI3540125.1 hypothetical protein CABS02_11171 [Colletotrichum abscissum]KAK1481987.1 hypothetical protein CABS01_14185 [Colletotrichum abscissum]
MQPNGLDRIAGLVRPVEKSAYAHLQDEELEQSREPSPRRRSWSPSVSQVLLFLISVGLLSATGVHHYRQSKHSHNQRTNVGNLEEIRGSTMFKEADTSGPSPELDAAWDKLIDERHFMLIPDEDFPKSEFRTREPLRASTSAQNGTLAVFEYVHALHCVHLMWKQTYPEYYKEDHMKMKNDPKWQHAHINHCADFLKQYILCNANLAFNTYSFNETRGGADVDIVSSHTCINLDAADDYANRHYVNRSELAIATGKEITADVF